jgi:hypothetical protein
VPGLKSSLLLDPDCEILDSGGQSQRPLAIWHCLLGELGVALAIVGLPFLIALRWRWVRGRVGSLRREPV